MKKTILFLSILVITFSLQSCAKTTDVQTYQFDIYSWDWSPYGTAGTADYSYIATHNIPDITSAVVNDGTVLGYIGNSSGWFALPFTLTHSGYSTNINYSYVVGGVGLVAKDTDLLSTAPSGPLTFKMVIITQKQMHLIEGVNTKNYYETADALNLK